MVKEKMEEPLYDCLGYFNTFEEAVTARKAAEIKYNYTQPKK
jgi:hypothetical protein